MILYHGSIQPVEKPEIRIGGTFLDFGVGFYTTTSYKQAERWAHVKMRREKSAVGYVSAYEFDFEAAKAETVIKRFDTANIEWLMFVTANRKGERLTDTADMHIGPVADDNIYRSIRFFETGVYDAKETVKRLKTEILHDQWAFHTDKALSFCHFIKATYLRG